MSRHSSAGERKSSLEKNTSDLEHQCSSSDQSHPELPFLRSIRRFPSSHKKQSYLQYILSVVGEDNVPSNLQDIIKGSKFENNDTTSDLYSMLERLKSRCNVMLSKEADEIKEILFAGISTTLHKLRETAIPLFRGVSAVLLGSAADQTKTSKPNEWDFVIFLPYFSEYYRHHFPIKSGNVNLDHQSAVERLEKFLYGQVCEKEDEDILPQRVCGYRLLKKYFVSIVQSCMKCMTFKHACLNHKAIPVTYTYKNFNIKMDIVFGIRDESNSPAANDSILVRPLDEQPPYGFYIMTDDEFLPTSTFAEVLYMRTLSVNIRLCYQLAKCLIEQCFPSYYSPTGSTGGCMCKKTLFPSYRLKLIVFYMCKFYVDDAFWTEQHFTSRIVELFFIYSMCLRYGTIDNLLSVTQNDTKYTKLIGKYNCIAFPDEAPDIENVCVLTVTQEEYCHGLSVFVNNEKAIESFVSVFQDKHIEDRPRFDGDIISAVCVVIFKLKTTKFSDQDPNSGDNIREDRHGNTSVVKHSGPGFTDSTAEELEEQQVITANGGVESMIIVPNSAGELLILTGTGSEHYRKLRFVKYKNNEVIQEMVLSDNGYVADMCYHKQSVTVLFKDKLKTYRYKDLTERSSFAIKWGCIGVTTLVDDSFVFLYDESRPDNLIAVRSKQVIRTTTEGHEICASDETFERPKRITTIKTQNTVAVSSHDYSNGLCVTCLSSDLRSREFIFMRDGFLRHDLCWNDETSSIFIFSPDTTCILELSDRGFSRRKLNGLKYPDTKIIVRHYMGCSLLTIIRFGDCKIMVFKHHRQTLDYLV